jgi:XTP/dITP diphosphohydrolase
MSSVLLLLVLLLLLLILFLILLFILLILLRSRSTLDSLGASGAMVAELAMATTLVVGTRNAKKRQEIFEILGDLGLEIVDLTRWPDAPEVVEDGQTFEANARKKAAELAKALHHWVLGEDSGLVVPALAGRPGVYSARYAGKQGDDAANNKRLLVELAILGDDQRAAYYVCTAALADPDGKVLAVVEGRCHGVIVKDYRGSGGFGYDPLFLIPEYHRTFGELSPCVKHALSHRGRALVKLRHVLHKLATEPPN